MMKGCVSAGAMDPDLQAQIDAQREAALNALGWRYLTIDASAGIEEVLRDAIEAMMHVASAR